MSRPELLQASQHGDLRVDSAKLPEINTTTRNTTVVFPEFHKIALDYPIVFTKNQETGAFSCVALFGFEEDENLFVNDEVWDTDYLPLNIVRGPFMLGTQKIDSGDNAGNLENVLLIDVENPSVSKNTGELLFNDRGFPTKYMENITSVVKTLLGGIEQNTDFINHLLPLGLISPAQLNIEFTNGERREIRGIYTINTDNLSNILDSDLIALKNKKYLEAIYAIILSFGHIQTLIDKKNKRIQLNRS